MKRLVVTFVIFLVLAGILNAQQQSFAWPVLKIYDKEHTGRIAIPVGGIGTGTISLTGYGLYRIGKLKHPNGKYYLYFKALSGPRPKGKISMGLAISNKLEGPYIIQPKPITANKVGIEDGYAFLWRNHICLLTTDNHGILEKGGGLLWVSENGMTFKAEPLSGFHNYQDFYLEGKVPEGANAHYGKDVKFERPQLLMDANNELEYLYCPSGVALDGSDGTNSYVLKYQTEK